MGTPDATRVAACASEARGLLDDIVHAPALAPCQPMSAGCSGEASWHPGHRPQRRPAPCTDGHAHFSTKEHAMITSTVSSSPTRRRVRATAATGVCGLILLAPPLTPRPFQPPVPRPPSAACCPQSGAPRPKTMPSAPCVRRPLAPTRRPSPSNATRCRPPPCRDSVARPRRRDRPIPATYVLP
jgi:hypothetical protein